ncbi:MAG: helix-turn-helix domain-containing protein [Moheibacter sp.]
MQKLQIKNMVCPRCVMAVQNLFDSLGIDFIEVRLGEVLLENDLNPNQKTEIQKGLQQLGFELLDDKNSALINQIKTLIIGLIQNEKELNLNLSSFLSKKLNRDYSQLSKLFSSTVGITIEQFTILQKIEKVKELLIYDELSLKEIAFRLGYGSTAYLSSQFKKVSGLTPTEFKKLTGIKRKSIDEIG